MRRSHILPCFLALVKCLRHHAAWLLICLGIFLAPAVFNCFGQLSTNNVVFNVTSFGLQPNSVTRITVQGQYWLAVPGTFFINPPQTITVASYPQLTNGSAVFSNQVCGVPYQVTISSFYGNYVTNYFPPWNAATNAAGNVDASFYVGQYVSPSAFYYSYLNGFNFATNWVNYTNFVIVNLTNGAGQVQASNVVGSISANLFFTNGTTGQVFESDGAGGWFWSGSVAIAVTASNITGNALATVTNIANGQTNGLVGPSITNGLVGPSITNGLASLTAVTNIVNSKTNGLVGSAITNGLVGPSITNGLVGPSVTNGFTGPSVTNGLASLNAVTNLVNAITNGFVGQGVTNGLATLPAVTNIIAAQTASLTGPSVTNGLASLVAVTNIVNGKTNGLVGPSITNGLAGPSITNGLVGPGVTNGLASLTAVTNIVNAQTNGLVGPSITNGLAGPSVTNGFTGPSVTNGLASLIAVTNIVNGQTNGLVGPAVTNGLAPLTAVTNIVNGKTNGLVGPSITNGLASLMAVTNIANGQTNGLVGPSVTNGLASLMAVTNIANGQTNGLVGPSVTNGLVGWSVTNGLTGPSVTNGMASLAAVTNIVNIQTNGLATLAAVTNIVNGKTNGLVGSSITNGLVGPSITNGTVAATNGTAYYLTLNGGLNFGQYYTAYTMTNSVVGVADGPAAGTYLATSTTSWTNRDNAAWDLVLYTGPTRYYLRSNAVAQIWSATLASTNWVTINGMTAPSASWVGVVHNLIGQSDRGGSTNTGSNFNTNLLSAYLLTNGNAGGLTNIPGANVAGAVPLAVTSSNLAPGTSLTAVLSVTNTTPDGETFMTTNGNGSLVMVPLPAGGGGSGTATNLTGGALTQVTNIGQAQITSASNALVILILTSTNGNNTNFFYPTNQFVDRVRIKYTAGGVPVGVFSNGFDIFVTTNQALTPFGAGTDHAAPFLVFNSLWNSNAIGAFDSEGVFSVPGGYDVNDGAVIDSFGNWVGLEGGGGTNCCNTLTAYYTNYVFYTNSSITISGSSNAAVNATYTPDLNFTSVLYTNWASYLSLSSFTNLYLLLTNNNNPNFQIAHITQGANSGFFQNTYYLSSLTNPISPTMPSAYEVYGSPKGTWFPLGANGVGTITGSSTANPTNTAANFVLFDGQGFHPITIQFPITESAFYTFQHGLGHVPSSVKWSVVFVNNDTGAGRNAGDVVDLFQSPVAQDLTADKDANTVSLSLYTTGTLGDTNNEGHLTLLQYGGGGPVTATASSNYVGQVEIYP
jgi:hypothetical protein